MGVSDFLRLALDSAGNEVDLRQYRDGITVNLPTARKRKRRNLRIGVDVSHWIYKATFRFGPMLGEEKHLTNYGRYQLVVEKNGQKLSEEQSNNNNNNNNTNNKPDPETVRSYVTSCCLFVIQRLRSLQNETNADILVVLDGATPPVKQKTVALRSQERTKNVQARDAPIDVAAVSKVMDCSEEQEQDLDHVLNKERLKANRRAGAGEHYSKIIEDLLIAMRINQIPFLVAPYEADGQLAYLSKEKYIDLIITEDSDLVAQGGVCMLYKMDISIPNNNPYKRGKDDYNKENYTASPRHNNNSVAGSFPPRGILLLKDDLGAVTLSTKQQQDDKTTLSLMDMSDAILAVMFVAAGSDYCEKLKGIGLVTACNIVRQSFLLADKRVGIKHRAPPLARVFDLLFQHTYDRDIQGDTKLQQEYKNNFLAAVLMYRHPVIYEPITARFVISGAGEGDPELLSYSPYKELFEDPERCAQIIGDLNLVDKTTATLMAEGWISPRTRKIYAAARVHSAGIPKALRLIIEAETVALDPQETCLEEVLPAKSDNNKMQGELAERASGGHANKTPDKTRQDSSTESTKATVASEKDIQKSPSTLQVNAVIGRLQESRSVNNAFSDVSKHSGSKEVSIEKQVESLEIHSDNAENMASGRGEGGSDKADIGMGSVSHLVANTQDPDERLYLETQEPPVSSTARLSLGAAPSDADASVHEEDITAFAESQEKAVADTGVTEPVAEEIENKDTMEGKHKGVPVVDVNEQGCTGDKPQEQENTGSSPPQTQQDIEVIELLDSSDDDSD